MKKTMRILFALPGLHRVHRGAEAAFEALAANLSALPDTDVTLIGAGTDSTDAPYHFLHAPLKDRERFRTWPSIPPFRSEYRYEECTFIPGLWKQYQPKEYDIAITCSYPFVQWALRMKGHRSQRPKQIFVTENGDWAARRTNAEYRLFDCDGLVCTNPEYYERHQKTWNCALIPNGIDTAIFRPGAETRAKFHLPPNVPIILMVSAMIPSKHPVEGIRAAARVPNAHLVIAGDGPLRPQCDQTGNELLGERYHPVSLPMADMPDLYRSADVLLHMSREEAFGNIYIEAAACGLPVVAHDYPTPRWILDDLGLFIDTSDEQLVAEKLLQAIASKPTRNAETAYQQIAQRFAWPVIADEYRRFFSDITTSQRKGMFVE